MIKDMEQELRYASFTQRWVGCVIDEIVIWSMVYLLYKWFFPTLFFINHPLLCLLGVILLFLVLSYSYYFLLELYFGRTLGKWICRTKVVDDNGNTIVVYAFTLNPEFNYALEKFKKKTAKYLNQFILAGISSDGLNSLI